MPDQPIRRIASFPYCGRLIALPTTRKLEVSQSIVDEFTQETSIDFPAMPDTVDLVRVAEYNVVYNVVIPDGVHQYKGTKPLEIPFNFRLHSFDEQFCPQGALTLLKLAARLHAFVLPIDTNTDGDSTVTAQAEVPPASKHDDVLDHRSGVPTAGIAVNPLGAERVFNPVACRLELIFVDNDSPGIVCNGYVREVAVKLHGPWLRGPGQSRNLPSAGDFSFTFVHRPAHGNNFNIKIDDPGSVTDLGLQPQAYATRVKDKLYNTRDLIKTANWVGFTENKNA